MKSVVTIGLFSVVISFNLCSQSFHFANTDFRKADSVALQYSDHSLNDLKSLAEKLTHPFQDDIEKFRAIYFWVCTNIAGDYQYYVLNEEKRNKLRNKPDQLKAWNEFFSKRVFNRLINEHKTVCTGYAYLIRELSYWAGLTSVMIDGYGRSATSNVEGEGVPNHSWNAVVLNNTWYLCDATWSSGTIDPGTGTFRKKFEDAYFLPPPDLFVRNHYPLDTAYLFLSTQLSLEEFLERPIVYKSVYQYQLTPVSPETLHVAAARNQIVSFQFQKSSGKEINKVELQINGRRVLQEIDLNPPGEHTLEVVFKNRGKHIVHLMLDSTYAITYLVNVN